MSKRLVLFCNILPAVAIALVVVGCAGAPAGRRSAVGAEETHNRKARAAELMSGGDYQGAIDLLAPLAKRKSNDSQIDQMLGEAYWRLGETDLGVTHFENSLRIDYSNWETHMKLAQVLMETGRTGRALTEFELALRFAGHNALAHYNYGLSLYEYGRRDQAIMQWEMALSLERSPQYAQALGMGYSGHNDGKALEYFELAAELGADDPVFHNNFGLLLTRMGRFRGAEAHLAAAVEAQPANDAYRTNLALLYMRSGRYEEAIPEWRRTLQDLPDARAARIYLGQAYYETGHFQEAVDVLEAWLQGQEALAPPERVEPGLERGFDSLAMSYRALGRLEPALTYIRRAAELAPANPVHLNNYGVILAESGKIDEARVQWLKVLDIEPDNAVARQNLSAFDR